MDTPKEGNQPPPKSQTMVYICGGNLLVLKERKQKLGKVLLTGHFQYFTS